VGGEHLTRMALGCVRIQVCPTTCGPVPEHGLHQSPPPPWSKFVPGDVLVDDDLESAQEATCGGGSPRAPDDRRRPRPVPDRRRARRHRRSRIDLVEDQHRWTITEHQPKGEHGPANSPPEATFASGWRPIPGLAAKSNATSAPATPSTRTSISAFGRASSGSRAATARASRLCCGSTCCLDRRFALPEHGHTSGPLLLECCGIEIAMHERIEPQASLAVPLHHLGKGVPVLATEILQGLATISYSRQRGGVTLDGFRRAAQLSCDIREFRGEVVETLPQALRTAGGAERRDHSGELVERAAIGSQQMHGEFGGLPVSGGISEDLRLLTEVIVLGHRTEVGGVEFGDLVPEQVDLAFTVGTVPTEGGELLLDRCQLPAGTEHRREVDPPEPVECPALHCSRQRLMFMSTTEIDERGAERTRTRRAWRVSRRCRRVTARRRG